MQLHRDHAGQVACISLNLNYNGSSDEPPESFRAQVLKVLTDKGATFQNVICSDPDEKLYEMPDLGSIPAVLVYDRKGALRKRFDNDKQEYGKEGFTFQQHVIPFVKQLLAEK